MSLLRNLEEKIAGLVEGTFGRAFRAEVSPLELAHKLEREMDDHRTVSLSRTYAPHRYVVWLSPQDRARFAGTEPQVIDELAGHLLEHARSQALALAESPHISFETDEKLALGEFGIEVPPAEAPRSPDRERPAAGGGTMIHSAAARRQEAHSESAHGARGRAALVTGGKRMVIGPQGAVIGRSRSCDVVIDDADVSRRHAEIIVTGNGWAIRDLGSTNGLRVGGLAVGPEPVPIQGGDAVEIGTVRALFEIR